MQIRKVAFHRLAAREFREAAAWYAARSHDARQRFQRAVGDAVMRVAAAPLAYSVAIDEFRVARAKRFPYLVVYELQPDDSILVIAVAHTSRRPGYWRKRK